MTSTSRTDGEIIIIGGGVGGLTLAQALLKRNIPFRLFERDASLSQRAQGYRIRISGDGVHALQKCLPQSVWETLQASAAGGIVGLTKLDGVTGEMGPTGFPGGPGGPAGPGGSLSNSGRVGVDSNGGLQGMRYDAKPIAVDRTIMRKVLTTGLTNSIEYGKAFQRYEITPSGITAHFADGTSYSGAFLVGVDGANSLVRKQYLPGLKVIDTGGRCIYGKTYITDELTAALTPNVQKNMTLIQETQDDGTPLTLFLEPTRFPNPHLVTLLNPETGTEEPVRDYIYWVLLSKAHIFNKSVGGTTPAQAAALSNELTRAWHKTITPLLLHQSPTSSAAMRILSVVPDTAPWAPSSRITLLGDAAHPMPPTAGLGAVSALRDVHKLVDAILEGVTEKTVGEYEGEMRRWANGVVEASKGGAEKFFGGWDWDHVEEV